jgi:hypothetical protein
VRSHLMSLGEYLALYLFAWSDVLWPATMPNYNDLKAAAQPILPTLKISQPGIPDHRGTPDFDDYLNGPVAIGFPAYLKTIGKSWSSLSRTIRDRAMTLSPQGLLPSLWGTAAMGGTWPGDWYEYVRTKSDIQKDSLNVEVFSIMVAQVRRALVNIPTYMICDDHEVTDDWNETRNFCSGVYGSPLGRRVVQNGLVAYALCQAWGNTPEQFEGTGSVAPAGWQLLRHLDKGTAQTYDQKSSSLQTLVGVHDDTRLRTQSDNAVFHDQSTWVTVQGVLVSQDSITFNYSIDGPPHQIIVTDSRTWRSFPKGGDEPPELIPKTQMSAQVGGSVVPAGQVLLAVFTTNIPPVRPIRSATKHRTIAGIYYGDLWDSWALPSAPFDRVLARLTDRLPADPTTGALTGPIILLSGDVHHSFASRMNFKGSARFEDAQPKAVSAVIAQLVSSSLKNQSKMTATRIPQRQTGGVFLPT